MFDKIKYALMSACFWFICWPLIFVKKGTFKGPASYSGCAYVMVTWFVTLLGIAGIISVIAVSKGAYK